MMLYLKFRYALRLQLVCIRPLLQVLGRAVKLVPYEDSHFQDCLQKATLTELQEMQSALLLRNSKLDSHILLLEKLESDELGMPFDILDAACV